MTRAEQLLITRKLLLGERGWIIHDGEEDPTDNASAQVLLWGDADRGNLSMLRPSDGYRNWWWGHGEGRPGCIMAYRFTD